MCDHPDCSEPGEYRAPRSRDRLNDFYWFCLDHVREYNKAWNYFAGMNDQEVERHVRSDVVWGRETWKLGGRFGDPGEKHAYRVEDPFNFFESEEEDEAARRQKRQESRARSDGPEMEALAIMGLDYPVTLEEVRTRYKQLAKKLHPDANGGDPDAEDRLKDVNRAYTTLRKWLS
ncbi:MAG: J domain-containing protein [Alphaproteobacteria bacterium]|nr:J domain-containing protein [Alphaproteobacteria bacterium]